MSDLIIYEKTNFQGEFFKFGPGDYLPNNLSNVGKIDFTNHINSVRIAPNVVVELFRDGGFHSGSSPDASRVIVGPADVPDLSKIGMDNKVRAIRVRRIKLHNSYVASPEKVVVYDQYDFRGKSGVLSPGQYDMQRLTSQEYKFTDNSLRSMQVPPYLLVILYDADKFDNTQNAIAVIGPKSMPNLDEIGFDQKITSMSVYGLENPELESQVTSANLPAPTDILTAGILNRSDPTTANYNGATSVTNRPQDLLLAKAEIPKTINLAMPVPGVYGTNVISDIAPSTKIILLLILLFLVVLVWRSFTVSPGAGSTEQPSSSKQL